MGAALDDLDFREVDDGRWKDMVRLFESRGAPSYCWCMAWRAQGEETKRKDADRKADLARRVRGGVPIGLLAYAAGEPIAWCSIAPRPTYRPLGGPEDPGADPDSVWSKAGGEWTGPPPFIMSEHGETPAPPSGRLVDGARRSSWTTHGTTETQAVRE